MRKRFLNVVLALGLVAGLIAGTMGSASADVILGTGTELVALPWVPNGETMSNTGPWYGSVTVQNIEAFRIWITFNQTAGGVINNLLTTTLEPFASKTFSAAQLGIPANSYAGVVVRSSWFFDANGDLIGPGDQLDPVCTGIETQTIQVTRGNTANGQDPLASADIIQVIRVYESIDPPGTQDPNVTNLYTQPDDFIYMPSTRVIDWSPAGNEPQAGRTYYVDVIKAGFCRAPQIGAVEKHITTGAADTGPMSTFAARTAPPIVTVDGYTGIPASDIPWGPASTFCALNEQITISGCNGLGAYLLGVPIPGTFDGHGYLPIVQSNNGWNTVIHVTNVDASSPNFASVTITLYAAGGQGAAGPSVGQFTTLLGPGQSTRWDISDLVSPGFIGSAWITSDYGMVGVANRLKPSTNMALTNQTAPSLLATTSPSSGTGTPSITADLYRMVAPLVFQNFNGWNTGVNIANIAEFANTVTVAWYNATGNVVGQEQVTIPAKGMEFVYQPYRQDYDLNPGFVGSAVLTSLLPFHAAIDEVKYLNSSTAGTSDIGAGMGQAMSYIATAAGASAGQAPDAHNETSPAGGFAHLSLPLVQKGNPATGMGDASGINLFNLAYTGAGEGPGTSTIWVWFFQPSGALAAPTLGQPMVLSLPAYSNATIYTMSPTNNLTEMSTGFQGSAIVTPTAGSGSIFGVSNNVNYAIAGDGSAVFNLINQFGQFRMFCSQNGDGTPLSGLVGCIYQ